MKTEMNDAHDSGKLEERLARRFAVELRQAERDYPALSGRNAQAGARPSGRSTRLWQRLAIPVTAIAAVLAVALIGAGLVHRPATSGPTAVNPAASGVVMGADGIPTQIDGQRVYRVDERNAWQNLSGSFLLGGYAFREMANCPALPQPLPSPEADLAYTCGGVGIGPAAGSNATSGGLMLATLGSTALDAWVDGPAIVVRVHTQDPEAAGCSGDQRAGCAAAIVTEAVVWPYVPTELAGERVYRAADQASFPTSGAFLLGGVVNEPTVIPPCPAPIDKSEAELQLIPYCTWTSIDGLSVAPKSSLGDLSRGQVVVARVHMNDPLAAQCPADVKAGCEAGIVVEAVVWRSGSMATATATTPATTEPTPTVAPTGPFGPLDADGLPTTVEGATVYRASNMPVVATTFLLGGKLTLDASCTTPLPTPAATQFKPPACGYWMVDGVKVGMQADVQSPLIDGLVVARVVRSKMLVMCTKAPCPPVEFLVVTEIVWWGTPAPVTPPPPLEPAAP